MKRQVLAGFVEQEIHRQWKALIAGGLAQTVMEDPDLSDAYAMPRYLQQTLGPLILQVAGTEEQARTAVNLVLAKMSRTVRESTVSDHHAYDFGEPITQVVYNVGPAIGLAKNAPELRSLINKKLADEPEP
jgi:hypothetical protein